LSRHFLQKISPNPSLPKRGIPPFCKGREGGISFRCLYNYGLISKSKDFLLTFLGVQNFVIPVKTGIQTCPCENREPNAWIPAFLPTAGRRGNDIGVLKISNIFGWGHLSTVVNKGSHFPELFIPDV
jgi:hypothetical protein